MDNTLTGSNKERQYVARLKAALKAYDSHYGRDDDPDTDDNGEAAIAAFLEARLDPDDYSKVMQALASPGNRALVEQLLGGSGDDEPDRDREDELDHLPLDSKRGKDQRVGVLPSVKAAMDAGPRPISNRTEAGFLSRFPSAVRPKQL